MRRKDFLYIPAALISCLVLGAVLLAVWAVLFIPAMIRPSLIPDPRPAIMGNVVKRGMRSAMQSMKGAQA